MRPQDGKPWGRAAELPALKKRGISLTVAIQAWNEEPRRKKNPAGHLPISSPGRCLLKLLLGRKGPVWDASKLQANSTLFPGKPRMRTETSQVPFLPAILTPSAIVNTFIISGKFSTHSQNAHTAGICTLNHRRDDPYKKKN